MKKIIQRTVGMKKEIGRALVLALQLITLTFIGLVALFASGSHQSTNARTGSQMTATEVETSQSSTAISKADLRASAVAASKLSGPRGTSIFYLAAARAGAAGQSELPNEATLTTDQEDYQPYTYVYITGTGFTPGETVNMIVVQLSPNPASYEPWDVVADANGNFQTSWYVFTEDLIGATMQVTATGQTSALTASATFTDAVPPKGVAPVNPPAGGFAIDGDLLSNTPTSLSPFAVNQGDWYHGSGGSGGNVLNSDTMGSPVDFTTTFHLVDPFSSGTDDNFAGGDKFDDNPNTWHWTLNPVNDKQDINNALIHVVKDPVTQHTWVVVAGDRLSNNGDAYIDFEFLQNTLTTTPLVAGTGGFSSTGPNCGRTVNDFVLTLELKQGGTVADFFVSRWEAVNGNHSCNPGTSYDYVDVTTPVITATPPAVFAAVNATAVTVPNLTAFGTNTYDVNTFTEAAVDLTALLGSFDPCLTVGINTILVKTKESQSPTANIVDFIIPQQLHPALVIGPTVDAGPDQAKCEDPSQTTSFSLTGTAQPGTYPITSTTWSCVSGCTGVNIGSPSTLSTTVTVSGGPRTVTLRLTVTDSGTCANHIRSDDVILTVNQLSASESHTPISCHGGNSTVTISATGGTAPYTGTGTFQQGVGSHTYTVTDSKGCTDDVTVTLSEPDTLVATENHGAILCHGQTASVTIGATGGTPGYTGTGTFQQGVGSHTYTVTDANGCTSNVTVTLTEPPGLVAQETHGTILCHGQTTSVTISATGGTGPYSGTGTFQQGAGSHTYTVTDASGCMSSVTVTLTEPDTLVATNTHGTIGCNGGTTNVIISATGGTAPYTGTGTFSQAVGSQTYTVTDANGCTSSTTVTLTQPSAVTLSLAPGACSSANNGSITATFGGGTGPYQVKIDTGSFTPATSPYSFTGLAAGSHTVTVSDANGCTKSSSTTVASCPKFCSLTQGAYGNKGGKYTYNGVKLTTTQLLQTLVPTGNPLVVGVPGVGGRSLTIANAAVTCLDGDNSCRLARLPGNTGPASLPSNFGNQTLNACGVTPNCQTNPAIPLQGNGQWQSTLLGQTVTLTLNTRLDPNLPNLALPSCVSISAGVLTALDNCGYGRTVAGLLNLANHALAGQSTCSASLSDINTAIDSINNKFNSAGNNNCPTCQQ